ncbi:MAG: hypothetical protein QM768_01950 [Agriterribacter sp.]
MKMTIIFAFSALFISFQYCYSQTYSSNVLFSGTNKAILVTTKMEAQGKLTTGEIVKSGCDHGACYFQVVYNGRKTTEVLGESFNSLKIYEFNFGGDGDQELVVIVDQTKFNKRGKSEGSTTFLYVYRYSKGLIQKIFEKEIMYYKTIIKRNYIEYYMPSGLDTIWHYYSGAFYEMIPIAIKN